jgi:hypothetical protein
MYRTMVRKHSRSGRILLCLLFLASSLSALEKSIELGKGNMWSDMQTMEDVTAVPGRWGFHDLALTSGEYAPDSATELLLHFDAADTSDATGAYVFDGAPPLVTDAVSALGGGSAAFTGSAQPVSLRPPHDAMFSPGAVWDDFTIEFWLYPATLSNGESIMAWTGALQDERTSRLVSQSVRCVVRDRKLSWEFQNLFTLPSAGGPPSGERLPVTLVGTRQLLPRIWHHHMVRFDSRQGLLEYRLDGVPEAILHVTDTGKETGSIAVARVGLAHAGPLVLGAGFTGFLDEVRISRRSVDNPVLSRFLGKTGAATSRILDLGFSSTRIARIDAVASTPSDSSVEYYYQAADTWNGKKLLKGPTDWLPFTPGADFKDTLKARYIQLRVELYPDGRRAQSPRVSDLTIVYEPNLPPMPPAGLTATAGNGRVTLTWRKVNDLGVKGYLVYYGGAPHTYLGTGAQQGDSPLDAGATTTMEIDGLDNGSLYYFAVTAYDSSDPRQQSDFSPEVSARPSRIFK